MILQHHFKIYFTIFLILVSSINIGNANNFESIVLETPGGTKYHVEMESKSYWIVNSELSIEIEIAIDQFGNDINEVELIDFELIRSTNSTLGVEYGVASFDINQSINTHLPYKLNKTDRGSYFEEGSNLPEFFYFWGKITIIENGSLHTSDPFKLGSIKILETPEEVNYYFASFIWLVLIILVSVIYFLPIMNRHNFE